MASAGGDFERLAEGNEHRANSRPNDLQAEFDRKWKMTRQVLLKTGLGAVVVALGCPGLHEPSAHAPVSIWTSAATRGILKK